MGVTTLLSYSLAFEVAPQMYLLTERPLKTLALFRATISRARV